MIRILDKNVADKIAAGEVIDRPVSIIKELVENSIDAGADSITVEIRNGGKSYIRVTDNGCGIAGEEIPAAFMRHATSKIEKVEDLDNIETLGFRGEALASICAVSRVEMVTRRAEDRKGTRVVAEESEVKDMRGTGCPEGTTITVRDLFFNLPARLKFLSSDASETRRITDMLSRMAMSYPDIRISFISGGKGVFTTSGKGNFLNNIVSIYGAETGKYLIPVTGDEDGMVLRGFVSNPSYTLSSRNRQIYCVNGRVVSSDVMRRGLEKGYRERLMQGRFPVAFLFLSVPGDTVDVNIHPAKKEVRFGDVFRVEDFISEAVARGLRGEEGVTRAVPETGPAEVPKLTAKPEIREEEKQVDIKQILSTVRHENTPQPVVREEPVEIPPVRKEFDFDSLEIRGTVFNTYIIAQNEDSFFMIDQHAAHERIFYEKMKNQYAASEKLSQQLLTPLSIVLPPDAAASEERWLPQLRKLGYGAEFFGDSTYLIREIPAFTEVEEAEDFLRDFVASLEDRIDVTDRKAIDRIIMRACKASVKGGDRLEPEEAVSLINQLKRCENPFSCPHGRPTFIRLRKYEIEKMFRRV
ncbi:MAG: DNA mismatch repair endonuclease MutL [Clostridiales bacterium]|nr:DNA mismatch repair endonuclease MutL [Clostridiales bacterium]MDD7034764.1 DNA mismatch repair endonuclease MutL [Bacillota bacterium]MDY2921083.1 DNA mismatch repair endonuclease MutL [Lentihominibacter sp.]